MNSDPGLTTVLSSASLLKVKLLRCSCYCLEEGMVQQIIRFLLAKSAKFPFSFQEPVSLITTFPVEIIFLQEI